MKKTKKFSIWPMSKGLDFSSVPGTQNPASLQRAKNIAIGSRPSLRKRPGLLKLPAIGNSDGVQNVTQFNGVVGGAKVSEIVRVRKGRFEALRDVDGAGLEFVDVLVEESEGVFVDPDIHPTDNVVFEQFANVLLICFENRAPLKYFLGGNLVPFNIRTTHVDNPPSFLRGHDYRIFYGGVGNNRDRLFVSAAGNIEAYNLLSGGFSIRYNDGDGDPIGLTGISPSFRGDIYVFKWNQIYKTSASSYGYSAQKVTDQAGAVSQNCIISTQNDIIFVDVGGIRSLAVTNKYGAAEERTLTWPIYEYFQKNINWSAYKNFKLEYDKTNATVLFTYTSVFSSTNDRVLCMNLEKGDFTEWENSDYSAMGTMYYAGRQRVFVHSEKKGLGLLDQDTYTIDGDPIDVDIETGIIFPFGSPEIEFTVTQAWLLAKPTNRNVKVQVEYSINSKPPVLREVDTYGDGYGSIINHEEPGGYIGQEIIGRMPQDLGVYPFKCEGGGASLQFRVKQAPSSEDPDQPFELYGIIYEVEYDEDSTTKKTV